MPPILPLFITIARSGLGPRWPGLRTRRVSARRGSYRAASDCTHSRVKSSTTPNTPKRRPFASASVLFRKVSTSCRLDYCQTNLRPGSFMNIGISTIHLPSRMQGWTSELLSCSIQISRMLPATDEKAAPEGHSSWPVVADSLRSQQRSCPEMRAAGMVTSFSAFAISYAARNR